MKIHPLPLPERNKSCSFLCCLFCRLGLSNPLVVMQHCYHQLVLFGDSITQFSFNPETKGFGAALANAYARKRDVMNRGFSGYNTRWALPVWRQIMPTVKYQRETPAKIELATIFLGANDAALSFSPQHIPLEEYKSNLRDMISMVQSPDSPYFNADMRLIVITPPPLNESQWRENCDGPLNRNYETTKAYAEAARQVAKEKGVVVADLWTRIVQLADGHLDTYLADGLHLSAAGNQAAFALLMETIATHFNEIHPDNLDMAISGWRELNSDNYEAAVQFPLLKN
ncbi:SGNH hydrolase-type esterase domain-containing protein [Dichotomocladium elegans]|nr:SGNH hydrolase-type esterase domain-containing protein [Dichotomocladium elegans]